MWDQPSLTKLLENVAQGRQSVEAAMRHLSAMPYEELGCANVDHHRCLRQGFPEVIYCPSKSPQQVAEIAASLADRQDRLLGTRATREQFEAARQRVTDLQYHDVARAMWLNRRVENGRLGGVILVAAGTGDVPVAEEAALTLELSGHAPCRIYDVGVAGLHRLLAHVPRLQSGNAIIVVAGMDGALPAVVAGLVAVPVIAVPTSVGYGAAFGGIAPLLTMLNSCAAGVAVVNIDNGYGAGHLAGAINRLACRPARAGSVDAELP